MTTTLTLKLDVSLQEANTLVEALQLLSGYEAFNSRAVAAIPQERTQATARYRQIEVLLAKFGAKPTPEVQRRFAEPARREPVAVTK